ncbi:Intraflagellar transport protein 43 [Trypanosoma melophagium]|uniref:Intraflagellar transport protein 43 n=1 Tax=Trypanosoma melophagium TaxID=715481 RepID=UPI00351A5A49|nr:Intraflagellar transport protein 43 [Trypanosoma melophagium]
MPPKFGRRAEEDPHGANAHNNSATNTAGASSTSSPETLKVTHGTSKGDSQIRPPDEVVQKDKLRNLDDGVDEQSRQQALEKAKEEKERLVNQVAEVPVGYNASMPKLSELDISNIWNDFLQVIHQDLDMSALTACLSQHLDDEDVPWNPDMLFVQLTSDMLDAAEGAGGAEIPPLQQAEREAVGEARRRRKVLLEDAGDPPEGPSRRRRAPQDPPADENDGKSPPKEEKSGGGKNAWAEQEAKTTRRTSRSARLSHAAKPAENAKAPQSGGTATDDAKKPSTSSKPITPKSEKQKEPAKK